MGQHKTNPTAIAAKRGEIPPKPKPMSKRETEQRLREKIARRYAKYLYCKYCTETKYQSVSVELAQEARHG